MTTRKREIESAGHALADGYYRRDGSLAARADAINEDGWTLDFSAPLGNILRVEGLTFDDDELRRVVAVALADLREWGWPDEAIAAAQAEDPTDD